MTDYLEELGYWVPNRGLLELLWTVYSEGKLQSCLKLKRPRLCTCCRVSEAKFYLYHSTKIAKSMVWV